MAAAAAAVALMKKDLRTGLSLAVTAAPREVGCSSRVSEKRQQMGRRSEVAKSSAEKYSCGTSRRERPGADFHSTRLPQHGMVLAQYLVLAGAVVVVVVFVVIVVVLSVLSLTRTCPW